MKKYKQKAIIFDFMRTLYNPERRSLEVDAEKILEYCAQKYDCYLVSYDEGERDELFIELGIKDYFTNIKLVERKTKLIFQNILQNNYKEVCVIGDRVESEIQIGNQLGFKSVWYKKGKFSNREPIKKSEKPNHIITELIQIKNIL